MKEQILKQLFIKYGGKGAKKTTFVINYGNSTNLGSIKHLSSTDAPLASIHTHIHIKQLLSPTGSRTLDYI